MKLWLTILIVVCVLLTATLLNAEESVSPESQDNVDWANLDEDGQNPRLPSIHIFS